MCVYKDLPAPAYFPCVVCTSPVPTQLSLLIMHFSKVFQVSTIRRESSPLELLPRTQDDTANAVAQGIVLGAMMFGLGPTKIITRHASFIFRDYTTRLSKDINESVVVTIRVLDKKMSYVGTCSGDTLEYDASTSVLKVTGGNKCQLPTKLKITGNADDVEGLSVVPISLEISSLQYVVEALEETKSDNARLEIRVATLESKVASIENRIGSLLTRGSQ